MISISNRGTMMPESPIRKLVPYADTAKANGIHVYHLNIGQPDIETPKPMLDAVRKSTFTILEYTHSAGNESYRKKLVGYYQRQNILVHYNDIIVTTGGSEAILFAFMGCMDVGDEVIVTEPFYACYASFAMQVGITLVPIQSNIQDGFALPSVVRRPAGLLDERPSVRPKGRWGE